MDVMSFELDVTVHHSVIRPRTHPTWRASISPAWWDGTYREVALDALIVNFWVPFGARYDDRIREAMTIDGLSERRVETYELPFSV